MKMFQDDEEVKLSTMNYFKSDSGEVFAYDAEQVMAGLSDDKRPMTSLEIKSHTAPMVTKAQLAAFANADARAYLAATDWYILRMNETGTLVPSDILDKRAAARASVTE